jgi:hypothetical protein
LEALSQEYDDNFLMRMLSKGGQRRTPSAIERIQEEVNSPKISSSSKSNNFKKLVRQRYFYFDQRDENQCVLVGQCDYSLQVAHFIPQSLLDHNNDSPEKKERKQDICSCIFRLCSWLPGDFFDKIDVCENAILLNSEAHKRQKAFEWFVIMETDTDGRTIYKQCRLRIMGF